jgi:hypothetical protein
MVMGGIAPIVNIEGLKPGNLVLDGPVKSGQGSRSIPPLARKKKPD